MVQRLYRQRARLPLLSIVRGSIGPTFSSIEAGRGLYERVELEKAYKIWLSNSATIICGTYPAPILPRPLPAPRAEARIHDPRACFSQICRPKTFRRKRPRAI